SHSNFVASSLRSIFTMKLLFVLTLLTLLGCVIGENLKEPCKMCIEGACHDVSESPEKNYTRNCGNVGCIYCPLNALYLKKLNKTVICCN
ncbi:hypothetical protein PENTCL1PPCAC_5752, partial [Pristionchus entomophagus]